MLILALKGVGFTVDTAKDGVDGLAKLRANKYDLLIADNQMPGLTGMEMIRQLHAKQIQLPIIMATGTLQLEDLVDLDFPLLKLLIKPFSLLDLLAMVDKILTMDSPDRGVASG